jgi:hypothetical protein
MMVGLKGEEAIDEKDETHGEVWVLVETIHTGPFVHSDPRID